MSLIRLFALSRSVNLIWDQRLALPLLERTVELEDLDDSHSQPKEHVLMPRALKTKLEKSTIISPGYAECGFGATEMTLNLFDHLGTPMDVPYNRPLFVRLSWR